MKDIEIDIKEFREFGFLQELNRKFLHPLGFALEVSIDDETGEETLGRIWDYRDDPEGMCFTDEMLETDEFLEKANRVARFMMERAETRRENLGYVIQPLPEED